jgi:hypothetical protein
MLTFKEDEIFISASGDTMYAVLEITKDGRIVVAGYNPAGMLVFAYQPKELDEEFKLPPKRVRYWMKSQGVHPSLVQEVAQECLKKKVSVEGYNRELATLLVNALNRKAGL